MEPRRSSREEGREGEGREEGGVRIQAFLPLDDLVLGCSLLWHCFLRKLSGPTKTSRFSPAAGSSPSPRVRHPAGAQYLLGKMRNVANFALGTFPLSSPHFSGEAEGRAGLGSTPRRPMNN